MPLFEAFINLKNAIKLRRTFVKWRQIVIIAQRIGKCDHPSTTIAQCSARTRSVSLRGLWPVDKENRLDALH